MTTNSPRLLNVGCGRRYHADWRNIDLQSHDPRVLAHDLTRGIPFDDSQFDAVYHSHVLEHLTPNDGRELIRECYRVMRPGGVLRIAVPDLEGIARAYLDAIARVDQGIPGAEDDLRWMQLEIQDQMVRSMSGGMMGPYMSAPDRANRSFIESRMGAEINNCDAEAHTADAASPAPARTSRWRKRIQKTANRWRRRKAKWSAKFLRTFYGDDMVRQLEAVRFRQSGENHQWMYDRISLTKLLQECGFCDCQIRSAFESDIPDFHHYELDVSQGRICKPDSLFMEARRPGMAAARAA